MCEHSGDFWKDVEERCPSWSGFCIDENGHTVFIHPDFPEGVKSYKECSTEQLEQMYHKKSKRTTLPITLDDIRGHICKECM